MGHVLCYARNGTEEEWDCDAIAICSGLHVEPYIPFVKGIENVPLVMHSSEFKQRKDFAKGKDVLVLGAGETAMDLSYLAVTSPTKSVTMCHRGGFIYAPKVLPLFWEQLTSLTVVDCSGSGGAWIHQQICSSTTEHSNRHHCSKSI